MSRELNTSLGLKLEVPEKALQKRLEKLEKSLVSQNSETEAEITKLLKKHEELEKQFEQLILVQEMEKTQEARNENYSHEAFKGMSVDSYLGDLNSQQEELSTLISELKL